MLTWQSKETHVGNELAIINFMASLKIEKHTKHFDCLAIYPVDTAHKIQFSNVHDHL